MFLDPPNGQKRLGTYVHVEHKIFRFWWSEDLPKCDDLGWSFG